MCYTNNLKFILSSELCAQMLLLHAFIGCDYSSRIYGVGKKIGFPKQFNGHRVLRSCAAAFTLPGKNPTAIKSLGNQAMSVIFVRKCTSSLEAKRY